MDKQFASLANDIAMLAGSQASCLLDELSTHLASPESLLRSTFSGDIEFRDVDCALLSRPLHTKEWPTVIDSDINWALRELLPGFSRQMINTENRHLATYLAAILIHYESINGDEGIPQIPLCSGIIAANLLELRNPRMALSVAAFASDRFSSRKDPIDADSFPCAYSLFVIALRMYARSVHQRIESHLQEGMRTWLWNNTSVPDMSLLAWRDVAHLIRENVDFGDQDLLNICGVV